jgi:hypothetical protein
VAKRFRVDVTRRRFRRLLRLTALTLMPLMIAMTAIYRDAFRTPRSISGQEAVAAVRMALPAKGVGYIVGNVSYEPADATTPLVTAGQGSSYRWTVPSRRKECFDVNPIPVRWPCRAYPYWVVQVTWPGDCAASVEVNGYNAAIIAAQGCGDISFGLRVQIVRLSLGQSGWS